MGGETEQIHRERQSRYTGRDRADTQGETEKESESRQMREGTEQTSKEREIAEKQREA